MRTIQLSSAFILVAGAVTFAACGAETPDTEEVGSEAAAVAGAVYTTFIDEEGCLHGNGNGINCNHYRNKCDVYVSGGPVKAGLSDGDYYFTILKPGAQNGGFNDGAGGNLSDDYDDEANRAFRVENHQIVENYGDHAEGETPNGKRAIQACRYADTPNPGGVYILAVCEVGATSPRQCKYDAFKVRDQAYCGDGEVDPGEECDDGNTNDYDECSNECEIPPRCGDYEVNGDEECEEDGDCPSGYSCEDCVCEPPPPYCGDGCIDEGEECEQDSDCDTGYSCEECQCVQDRVPCCGDGYVDPGEECDDQNTVDTDACTNACQYAECGDGIVWSGQEECDDGNADDLYCDSYCEICTPQNGTFD